MLSLWCTLITRAAFKNTDPGRDRKVVEFTEKGGAPASAFFTDGRKF